MTSICNRSCRWSAAKSFTLKVTIASAWAAIAVATTWRSLASTGSSAGSSTSSTSTSASGKAAVIAATMRSTRFRASPSADRCCIFAKEVPGPFLANACRPLRAKEFVCGQGQQHITRQHGKERARVQYDGKSIIGHHLKIVPADVLTSPDELVQCTASLDLHSLLVDQNVLHQDTPMTSHLAERDLPCLQDTDQKRARDTQHLGRLLRR